MDPDVFTKIQSLSDKARADFLSFLGVRDASEAEIADLLGALYASLTIKQMASGTKPH